MNMAEIDKPKNWVCSSFKWVLVEEATATAATQDSGPYKSFLQLLLKFQWSQAEIQPETLEAVRAAGLPVPLCKRPWSRTCSVGTREGTWAPSRTH